MHPTIAQALAPFVPAPESLEVAAYRARLRRFDWQFEFSDDARTVLRPVLDDATPFDERVEAQRLMQSLGKS